MLFLMVMTAALLSMMIGCSDDDATSTGGTNPQPLELVDIGAIIAATAPPEFSAPVTAPGDSLGAWTSGDYPLLENVLGSHEPQALYTNIEQFEAFLGIVIDLVPVNTSGQIIVGVYSDSVEVTMEDTTLYFNATATVTAISGLTTIPADANDVLGTQVDVDYLVSIDVQEMPGSTVKFGILLSDTAQTLLRYEGGRSDEPGKEESQISYANLDPRDSSYTFRGVGYVDYTTEQFKFLFEISCDADGDFAYRNCWYSNGSGAENPDFRHSIVGGGNRDTEFALQYRMFSPADTTVCDSTYMYDQVFGPNYSAGTGLISAYEDYLGDALIYDEDLFPTDQLTDPWD